MGAIWGDWLVGETDIVWNLSFEKIDMPSEPGTPTLDQLRVFLTVVDVGSFAGAARRLGLATRRERPARDLVDVPGRAGN